MKRLAIISVFAVFSAIATTGCFSETVEGDPSDQVSASSHVGTSVEEQRSANRRGAVPAQTLELNLRPGAGGGEKPHPEPWLDREKPHPEPWAEIIKPDPNSNEPTKP